MILIIGGAHQGKLTYAKEHLGVSDADIFTCAGTEIDFKKRCIRSIEEFTLACVRDNIDPITYFEGNRDEWQDAVFICRDIFCGVVPMGADMRAWRQQTGRLCQYLSKEAQQVSRIFCGLEQRLK